MWRPLLLLFKYLINSFVGLFQHVSPSVALPAELVVDSVVLIDVFEIDNDNVV